MYPLFTIIVILASIFLIFIVLVQNSKGGGLAAGFQSSNNIMGVRKTTDFVEKATWWAVGIVVVFSIATVAVHRSAADDTPAVSSGQLLNLQTTNPAAVNPGFGEEPQAE